MGILGWVFASWLVPIIYSAFIGDMDTVRDFFAPPILVTHMMLCFIIVVEPVKCLLLAMVVAAVWLLINSVKLAGDESRRKQ